MAVSINAGGNMRADFMISDAMLPQRIEEVAKEQAGIFAKLLGDMGDAKDDLAVEVVEVAQKYSDKKDSGEAVLYRDKETGMELPEDPRKLAELIVKGKVKLSNVPSELVTPELMKLIMLMIKAGEFNKDGEKDYEDEDESLFDPAEAIVLEQKFQQEISNSMLMELYQIMEKHSERESEDKVTMLDGICEPIDPTETLPSIVSEEQKPAVGEDMFTQLIDNLAETVSEGFEKVEETAVADGAIPDVGLIFKDGGDEQVLVSDKSPNVPGVSGGGDVQRFAKDPQEGSDYKAVQILILDEPENVSEDAALQPAASFQAAASQNEQAAESAAQQTIPVEEFTVKTEKTEAKPEVAENAVKVDNTEQPVVVKAVTRNENAQQIDRTVSEEPKTVTVGNDRVKSAAEELEMLRNAKARIAEVPVEIKPEADSEEKSGIRFEVKSEPKIEVKAEQTAQPLNADMPVVFRRDDGSEIEVRPSEIINQTAKLVEKAITENDDKTEYSLVLNPEELGRITVKLTKAADGAISITIAAENARTQRILEQHSDAMQDNLRSNGLNLESWQTVNERQQETAAQDYNGSSKNPYFRNDDSNTEEESDVKSFADIIASM